ncbi:TonB-linked outer membrane protein, SusC/RagA family [Chitinophaga eiseniae]|uniref:TonB-linked outer membrane protein, SusC/RagA family n=2 Tax=Chitinophaga eiseniae TaxID=634771 RepID=A0A1T4T8Q4_9BACT|nr:TonB-linked outer membrane protein, SusC/RagA family [Chitinophaga eiseniae]
MYQMKAFITAIVLTGLVQLAQAQDTTGTVISNVPDSNTAQAAFRSVNRNELPGGISVVDVASQMTQNYMNYSLENMECWANGFNGNSMWGMGTYLLLIDGVPRDATNVLPAEIDQVSFLKGVNAVALYGSRAAKGVIYITTKRGKPGNQRIAVRANGGITVPKGYPEYLGSAEYMTLYNEARRNDGLADLYTPETIDGYASGKNKYRYPDVDYYSDEYLRKFFSRYDVTAEISGGNNKARYYTNIGYQTSGSLLNFGEARQNGKSDRLNLRGNVNVDLNDYISCNIDAGAIFYTGRGVNTDYWSSAATLRPYRFAPLIPIDMLRQDDEASNVLVKNSNHIIDGKYLLGGTQLDQTNPFAAIYAGGNNRYISRQFLFNTGVNADLRNLLKGLSFHATFAVDYNTSYNLAYNNSYAVYAPAWNRSSGMDVISSLTQYGQDATSGVQNVSNSWYRQTIAATGQFNYLNTIGGKHHLSAVLLVNGFQQSESAVYHRTSNANLGLQLGYDFNNTYYVDMSSAMVHSAKLPEGNRSAFSPTVSLGWRISNAPFLRSISVIDNLRLTASAGVLHTDLDILSYYLYQGAYTTQGSWFGWKDGTGVQATESRRGANPDLRFPKREEFSIGLDGSFFHQLIKLNGNFFINKITGNIIQPDVLYPSYFATGFPLSSFIPYINYNDDKRVGFDFNLSFHNKLREVSYSIGLVGSYYKSIATKRAELYADDYQRRQGKPLDAIWGLKNLGFFRDENDIKNSPAQAFGQVKPGDIKYKDQNGDGVIDARDEVYLGRAGWSGSPLTLGINLGARWRNFSFMALGVGRFGAYSMKNNSWFWVAGENKYSAIVRDRWTPETPESAKYPRLTTLSSDNNFRNSDFWLYKTNRIGLEKVQISYDMSGLLGKKKVVKEMGVYVSAFNLLTISAERKVLEMNVGSAPQTRLYNLGIKGSF